MPILAGSPEVLVSLLTTLLHARPILVHQAERIAPSRISSATALVEQGRGLSGVPADALAGEMPGSAEAFAKEDERYFGPDSPPEVAYVFFLSDV